MGKLITKNPEHKMVFTKYVEIGRIVVVGQAIYTIVDVIDNRHVMIDSPKKDSRKKINMNNMQLTKFKLEFMHGARTATVKKAWEAAGMDAKWAETAWAKKMVQKNLRAIPGHETQAGQTSSHPEPEMLNHKIFCSITFQFNLSNIQGFTSFDF